MNTVLWRLIFTYFVSKENSQREKRLSQEKSFPYFEPYNRFTGRERFVSYEFQCAASFDDIVATYFCFQILENPCKCLRSV